MNFDFPGELREFANEVRAFVRRELPPSIRERVICHQVLTREEQTLWQRRLLARGWAAPSWPEEHGGPGWNAMQRHVFAEVLAEEGAPEFLAFGQTMLAPVLMAVGTPEQKAYYLPRILSLDDWWCQGFSEPDSGSDLASLKTRAVLEGDHWVINGQKIWTSFAHMANRMFCLVRTDPTAKKQAGITMLMLDMESPGLQVRPIITIDGNHAVNEVFFDNVRVPVANTVGKPNEGWSCAKLLLGHERTGIARIGQSKRDLNRLKAMAMDVKREFGGQSMPLLDYPSFRDRVAAVEIDLVALELTNMRLLIGDLADNPVAGAASLLKIKGSEITQQLTELMMEAAGPYALPFQPEFIGAAPDACIGPAYAPSLAPAFLRRRVATIYGGSNEIQRNIIAKSDLGL